MHVYKELQSVGTCKGTNIYVSSHKAGSYTYTCEHVHVYKEVQSLSIRKGTNKCESAQHRSIYQRIRDMILDICIFVSI